MSTPQPSAPDRHVRGSSLLLFGRVISVLLNFAAQVVIVRYLSKQDYGALSFALAAASMGASLNLLGLNRAVNRFVPIYQEERRYAKMVGAILFAVVGLLGLGVAIVAIVFSCRDLVEQNVASDPRGVELLLILIALAPVQALDNLMQGLATIFIGARAVFFRRHILGPGLKLVIVLGVVGLEGSVQTLAWCHLAVGILGLATYGVLLYRALSAQDWWRGLRWREVRMPVRTFLGFGLPLVTADIVLVLKTTMAVVFLEHFHGSEEVAEFRSVVPVAGLSLVVLQSFKFLFVPLASRLFARGETDEISDLFWKTAAWIAVITFPVFAICILHADWLVVTLFEDRYSTSASVLVILTLGNYLSASMGLNAYTLQVFARVRFMALVNVISAVFAVAMHLILIPRAGAVGAAWSVTLSLVVQNVLNHWGLAAYTPVRMWYRRYLRTYATIVVAGGVLMTSALLTRAWPVPNLVLLGLVSLLLLRVNRRTLDVINTFPELRRVPLLGRILS